MLNKILGYKRFNLKKMTITESCFDNRRYLKMSVVIVCVCLCVYDQLESGEYEMFHRKVNQVHVLSGYVI